MGNVTPLKLSSGEFQRLQTGDTIPPSFLGTRALQPIYSGKWRTTIFSAAASSSSSWATFAWWIPYYIEEDHFVTDIGLEVTTLVAASNIALSLYTDSNGLPGTPVESSGNLSAATTGLKSYTFTGGTGTGGARFLQASNRLAWLCFEASSNTIAVRSSTSGISATYLTATGGISGYANQSGVTFGTFPNPAVVSGQGTNIPLVCLKAQ